MNESENESSVVVDITLSSSSYRYYHYLSSHPHLHHHRHRHRHHGHFIMIPNVRLTCSLFPVIITDVAVSAPYAGVDQGGVVYIYFGTKAGIETSPRQVSS